MSEAIVEQIVGQLQKLTKSVGHIETELQSIKAELQCVKMEQQSMKANLQLIEMEQQHIKQTVLETNNVVKRLELVQEQQQGIIELLSSRSIEQEAALKHII